MSLGDNRSFIDLTRPLMELYAAKTGSEFIVIDKNSSIVKDYTQVHANGRNNNISYVLKIKAVWHYLELYDRVLWLDDTCVVKPTARDLFDIMPCDTMKAFNEGSMPELNSWKLDMIFIRQKTGFVIDTQKYINAGVVLYTQKSREYLGDYYIDKHAELFGSKYVDQGYLNFVIQQYDIPIAFFDSRCNRMMIQCEYVSGREKEAHTIDPQHIIDSDDEIYHVTGFYADRHNIVKKLCRIVSLLWP